MTYERRKCLFYGEEISNIPEKYRPKAFKVYTMINCLLECDATHIMEECGCLPYSYPNFKQVWDVETSCNVTGLQCLADKYCMSFDIGWKLAESDNLCNNIIKSIGDVIFLFNNSVLEVQNGCNIKRVFIRMWVPSGLR